MTASFLGTLTFQSQRYYVGLWKVQLPILSFTHYFHSKKWVKPRNDGHFLMDVVRFFCGEAAKNITLWPSINRHCEASPNFIGNNEIMTGIASWVFVPQTHSQWRKLDGKRRGVLAGEAGQHTPSKKVINIVIASNAKQSQIQFSNDWKLLFHLHRELF